MKKVTYASWVSTLIENLSDYLNFSGWEISIHQAGEGKAPNPNTYACIDIDSTYQMAEITLFPIAKEDFDSGNIDRLAARLVHELVHIFIDPFNSHATPFLSDTTRPFFTSTMENATQKLTMVLLKNLPKSIIPPR